MIGFFPSRHPKFEIIYDSHNATQILSVPEHLYKEDKIFSKFVISLTCLDCGLRTNYRTGELSKADVGA